MADREERQPLPSDGGMSPIEMAGLAGGAALGFKYRRAIASGVKMAGVKASGAMRGAAIQAAKSGARNTTVGKGMSSIGTYLKSLDSALDQRGPLFHLRNGSRFDERFTRTFTDLQAQRMRMAKTPLGGRPTQIQNEWHSMMKDLSRERRGFQKASEFDAAMKRLTETIPKKMDDGLRDVLSHKQDDLFYENPSVAKVDELLKKHSSANAKKENLSVALDFVDDLERKKTAETVYNALSGVKKDKAVKEVAQKNYKEYRDIRIQSFKDDHSVAENKWVQAAERQGLKPLTLEDALNKRLIDKDKDSFLVPYEKTGNLGSKNLANNLRMHMKSDPEMGSLHVDPGLFVDKSGKVVDMRNSIEGGYNFLDIVKDNVQLPYLRFNPLDLAHYSSVKTIREAPKSYVLKRGTIDPYLQGAKTVRHPAAHNQDAAVGALAEDHIYVGGSVYRMSDMAKVDDGMYLADRRFGVFSRMPASMANLHVKDYGSASKFQQITGFGLQESESSFSRIKSMFTKFKDPDWEINQVRGLMKGEIRNLDEVEGAYKNIYNTFHEKTQSFSDRTAEFLNPTVKKAYGNVGVDLERLNTNEEIMGTLGRIRNAIGNPEFDGQISKANTSLVTQIDELWRRYSNNPQAFLKNKRIQSDNGAILPEFASALETGETELVSIVSDAKRLIHQHSIDQASMKDVTVSTLVREGILEGKLDKEALADVRNLGVLSKMRTWWDDVYKKPGTFGDDALREFQKTMQGEDSILGQAIHQSVKEFNPITSTGPGTKPPSYYGPTTGYGLMRNAKGMGWAQENYDQLIEEGHSSTSALLRSAKEVLKQPFAGRNNLGDVTTATTFFYYGIERMDNALSKVGMGLAQRDKGSMQSVLWNQLGKRILLPYLGYKQLEFMDDMTGDFVSDKLADTYVNMHSDLAGAKEMLGINRIGKELSAPFAGIEQIGELPFMKAFDFMTFGAFSDWRSSEEVDKFYESGEVEVRKGRYWGLGSNTPWMGGKIERYEPNWYRRMKSDYEYTDTLYGSSFNYWANTWVPTPLNPLAPLTHLLGGNDFLEEKHRDDRPYPITGGTILGDIPLVGPVVDNTIGRILSPRVQRADLQQHHEAYQEELIKAASRRFDAYDEGATIQFLPAGGMQVYEDIPSLDGEGGISYGDGGGGAIGYGGSNTDGNVDVSSYSPTVTSSDYSSAALQAINNSIIIRGQAPINQAKTRPFSQLESLRDPEALSDLADIGEVGNLSGVARDAFYSWSEVLGIYGFGTKALSGFQESGRGLTLEPSSRMDSMARSFWDMELGGADMVGGGFSEIFRRYVPRDPNKQYYNPIRNKMPDWIKKLFSINSFNCWKPLRAFSTEV